MCLLPFFNYLSLSNSNDFHLSIIPFKHFLFVVSKNNNSFTQTNLIFISFMDLIVVKTL